MNEFVQSLNSAIQLILPETVLIATVCVSFLAGPLLVNEAGVAPSGLRHRWGVLALLALLFAAGLWWRTDATAVANELGPFRLDHLTWFIRGLSLAFGIMLLLINWNQVSDALSAELHACLLVIVAGVNLVAAANDLVGLFLALELISLPTYVFLYLPRRDAAAQEATLKYFLLSLFSSALVLYGFSFLYGLTGTTNLSAIQAALGGSGATGRMPILLIPLVTVIAGLGFRITAVPFHFYAPDVFQGTPTSGAALLSVVPKVAGFVALLRILVAPTFGGGVLSQLPALSAQAGPILWWLAVLTMFVGNTLALLQTNLKRLLAYSSIAHGGYMLVGLAVGATTTSTFDGRNALLFYLTVYGTMTAGVFAVLVAVSRDDRPLESIEDLSGLSQARPVAALLLMVLLFSLTGLPPTAGFLGKLNLFLAAWSEGTASGRALALLMAMNAAIGAWYYLRLIGVIYLHPATRGPEQPHELPALISAVVCTVATLALFFFPESLWQAIQRIAA